MEPDAASVSTVPTANNRRRAATMMDADESILTAPIANKQQGRGIRSGRSLVATAVLAGCVVFHANNELLSYNSRRELEDMRSRQMMQADKQSRMLRSEGSGGDYYDRFAEFVSQLFGLRSSRAPEAITSRGPGPELTDPARRVFRFHGETSGRPGVRWYRILSSPRFQWNAAPYRWSMCPDGEDKFLGRAGFAFHEPHPQHPDPSRTVSKYLQFQVLRRDERECLWNYSKTCLAGGSFAMKFGKTARDILHPGDYKLKTSDGGVIRIVAYNTNRDCTIASTPEVRPQSSSP